MYQSLGLDTGDKDYGLTDSDFRAEELLRKVLGEW